MEIFEYFFQFWFLEMVYMDSNMIIDCKCNEKKAKEETQRREEHVVIFRGVRQSWEIYVR